MTYRACLWACVCGWSFRVVTLQLDSVCATKQRLPPAPVLSLSLTALPVQTAGRAAAYRWPDNRGESEGGEELGVVKRSAVEVGQEHLGWGLASKRPKDTWKSDTRGRTREQHDAWKEGYNSEAVAGKGQALFCEMSRPFNSLGGNHYGAALNVICWVKHFLAAECWIYCILTAWQWLETF